MKNVKGKNVLVTGADGFIGSHLVEKLLEEGANVKALVFYNSFNNWGLLEDLKNNKESRKLNVVLGDIRDTHFCMSLVKNQEIIFNLAALVSIPYSYISPASYFQTNVLGTINLLEASRYVNIKKFIQISTSEVYGTALYTPIDEKHPMQPQSPYSASKIGSDSAALSYFYSFNLPVTIARPFNNYGPRQSARGVIPTIISQLLSENTKYVSLGSLKPIRDYVYVKDTAEGLIKISLSEKTDGDTVNIGMGKGYSIKKILDIITKITGKNKKLILDKKRIRPTNSEVWKLICDNRKLERITGWYPKTSFQDGLISTTKWIENNLDKYKSSTYNY